MKKLFVGILILFLIGCNASKTLLERGDYKGAVKEAVRKLKRNPKNEKQIKILEQAYPLAVKENIDKINELNAEGRPDRWEQIYYLYSELHELQKLVETVTPISYRNGKTIKFKHVNYLPKINDAKHKAAEYYYKHAKELMKQDDKFAYRQAYNEFEKAKKFDAPYSDIDKLMKECYEKGQTYVILVAENKTFYKLSDDFMINLIDLPIMQLNTLWVKYYNTDELNGNYDVWIYITLKIIDVSPDNLEENTKVYQKEVLDGYTYKKDSEGNLVKDSTGKPIKIPKYKTVKCQLKEYRQFKIAHIEGEINYVDGQTNQVFHKIPIAADHVFENFYYTANGVIDALPKEKRKLLNTTRPIPYPHPLDMIYEANETLRQIIFKALQENNYVIIQNY